MYFQPSNIMAILLTVKTYKFCFSEIILYVCIYIFIYLFIYIYGPL